MNNFTKFHKNRLSEFSFDIQRSFSLLPRNGLTSKLNRPSTISQNFIRTQSKLRPVARRKTSFVHTYNFCDEIRVPERYTQSETGQELHVNFICKDNFFTSKYGVFLAK